MRALLAVAVLCLSAAVAWWLLAEDDRPTSRAPVPAVAGPLQPRAIEPQHAALAVSQRDAGLDDGIDAGPRPHVEAGVDVEIELLGSEGHAAGVRLLFETAWDGGVQLEGSAMTNVMGFARVQLVPETYEVTPETDPPVVTIRPETRSVVLRQVSASPGRTVSGLVIDEDGRGVPGAEIGRWDEPTKPIKIAVADEQGRFAFRTQDESLVLLAWLPQRSPPRSSRASRVKVPSKEVRLRIVMNPAFVRFRVRGTSAPRVFLEYEWRGDVLNAVAEPMREIEMPAGHLTVRARAAAGILFTGRIDLDLEPGSHHVALLEMKRSNGLIVRVVDGHSTPVSAIVRATGCERCSSLEAETSVAGTVEFVPSGIDEYNPQYKIEVLGAWRNEYTVYARLGDGPITVTVRPFNAATDSTDAGAPIGSRR